MFRSTLLFTFAALCCGCNQDLRFDSDGDGVEDAADCDPGDAARYAGAQDDFGDGIDQDCDGGDGIDRDGDQLAANATELRDCDDQNAEVHPGAFDTVGDAVDLDCDGTDGTDADGDGFASVASGGADCDDGGPHTTPMDGDGDGASACAGDCDDADAGRSPADEDGDGVTTCDAEADCDDRDASVRPGAGEVCDGVDSDCDGAAVGEQDEDLDADPSCSDCDDADPWVNSVDADGDGVSLCDGDCQDGIVAVSPFATDTWGDGTDQNCDGADGVDADGDGEASVVSGGGDCDDLDPMLTSATDADGDGHTLCDGDCDDASPLVFQPLDQDSDGFTLCDGDCQDGQAAVHPGAPELCDGFDDDCDAVLPASESDIDGDGNPVCAGDCDDLDSSVDGLDADNDGVTTCGGDCQDGIVAVNPFATDTWGDAIDQNCDGVDGADADGDGEAGTASGGGDCADLNPTLDSSSDGDADGVSLCAGDCDDSDPLVFLAADSDSDGFTLCSGDCDDGNAVVRPGAPELCDGADTNCDGVSGPGETDSDSDGDPLCSDCDDADPSADTLDRDADGFSSCQGDCYDTLAVANPFATDLFGDGVDQNCDGADGFDADGDGEAGAASGGADCRDADPGVDSTTDADEDLSALCDGDCADSDPLVRPGQSEACDSLDTDCDGVVLGEGDLDGDGAPDCADCGVSDATRHLGAPESCDGIDQDCDGSVDDGFDQDGDGSTTCAGDCDDGDPALESLDLDDDGFSTCDGDCLDGVEAANPFAFDPVGDGLDANCDLVDGVDFDGDGQASVGSGGPDCADSDAAIHLGATETCDGLDQDCDGDVDDGFDLDGDTVTTCAGDCDDGNPDARPGAPELCDGVDTNCLVDDADEVDGDADGWPLCDDCADGDASRHPGAVELCDGIDQNCDGLSDEGWDGDLDGYTFCQGDCDNLDATRHPAATELCDGIDQNCDSSTLGEEDVDVDGFRACQDCADGDAGRYPGAAEVCDFLDQDCDTVVDEGFDLDADGWPTCEGDCGDNSTVTFPNAPEICDSILDNDCDGQPGPLDADTDADGSPDCEDCQDNDPTRYPTASELCDGVDNDCDFLIDEGSDPDADGYTICGGDCDDQDAAAHPGATERCNGSDDNCDGFAPNEGDIDADGFPTCGDCDDSNPEPCEDCDDGEPATCGAVGVAIGTQATYVLLEGGSVLAFGGGAAGRLGHASTSNIGDNEPAASAGYVPLGGPAVQVVAGLGHACALLEDGAVRCWGDNNLGQLGLGTTAHVGDDEVPTAVGTVDVGGEVLQLSAGYYHTCALMQGGTVRCWGHGSDGRLGYGNPNTIGNDETPASAGDVDVGEAVVQIAAGGYHTCALLTTGAVRCWGHNAVGQLGYGHTSDIGDNETPASAGDVDVGGNVVQVAAGGNHTCAVLTNGSVRCWGEGSSGKLGYGNVANIGNDETPASVGDVPLGFGVVDVALGNVHTCARSPTGFVACWGGAGGGMLGYGNSTVVGDNEFPSTVGFVNVGLSSMSIAAGHHATCALTSGASVRCWGDGSNGGLGYGNTNNIGDNETPASAGDVPLGPPPFEVPWVPPACTSSPGLPVALAGPDISLSASDGQFCVPGPYGNPICTGPLVCTFSTPLDGSASSDSDGSPLGFEWSTTGLPTPSVAALFDAFDPVASLFATVPAVANSVVSQTAVVTLIVVDCAGNEATTSVNVTLTCDGT